MQLMKCADILGRLRRVGLLIAIGCAAAIVGANSGRAADACASLKELKIEDATITAAESVPAGSFTAGDSKSYANLPAFCRVTAILSPVHDSAIRIEMWLPQDGWKGVFEGTGNGGFGGRFIYPVLAAGLRRGYAVINTDQGTVPATALNGDDLVGHPVKWRDWGFRSTHLMTVAGKQIASAFYGKESSHAYFTGCSTGGQQALVEAQLYPADYDGIVAGAPVVNRTHRTPPSSGAARRRIGRRAACSGMTNSCCSRRWPSQPAPPAQAAWLRIRSSPIRSIALSIRLRSFARLATLQTA
jgi:hypothetical protein